jgi:hypothetical protein
MATRVLAAELGVNTTLTKLNLWGNSIGGAGAASLAGAPGANTTLTELNLERNTIGDAGAASVADALGANTTLAKLDLGLTSIGAAGAIFTLGCAWDQQRRWRGSALATTRYASNRDARGAQPRTKHHLV